MSLLRNITLFWNKIECFLWEHDGYPWNFLVQCWYHHDTCGFQYYCSSTCNLDAAVSEFSNEAASGDILTSKSEDVGPKSIKFPFKPEERAASVAASSNGRVMLIDGTSIIYRAYYKLLGIATHVYIDLVFLFSSGLTLTDIWLGKVQQGWIMVIWLTLMETRTGF